MYRGLARTRTVLLLIITIIATTSTHAGKEFHRWYDENGQAVYSQFEPVNGVDSQRVKAPPPPAEPPEVAQQRLQEQIQKSADFFEDRELAREQAAKAETETRQNQERCEAARGNLEQLAGSPNRLVRQSDGSYKRLDEADRERRREEMEKIIEESCK